MPRTASSWGILCILAQKGFAFSAVPSLRSASQCPLRSLYCPKLKVENGRGEHRHSSKPDHSGPGNFRSHVVSCRERLQLSSDRKMHSKKGSGLKNDRITQITIATLEPRQLQDLSDGGAVNLCASFTLVMKPCQNQR